MARQGEEHTSLLRSEVARSSNGQQPGSIREHQTYTFGEDFGVEGPDYNLPPTPDNGLSSVEAAKRLAVYGSNDLHDASGVGLRGYAIEFTRPLALLVWLGFILSCLESRWADALALLLLQAINATINWNEGNRLSIASNLLRSSLTPEAKVKRDGVYQIIKSSLLVPGDRVSLPSGAAVMADCMIVGPKEVVVDESSLTGPSMRVRVRTGDAVRAGGFVIKGETEAVVTATGSRTLYWQSVRSLHLLEDKGLSHSVVMQMLLYLFVLSLFLLGFCLGRLFAEGYSVTHGAIICSVILISCIPINLQMACQTIIGIGSQQLAQEKVVVTSFSAIEALARVNLLLTEKTGMLTRNKLEMQSEISVFAQNISREDVLVAAALASKWKEPPKDAIDVLCLNALDLRPLDQYEQLDYQAFTAERRRSEAILRASNGAVFRTTKGCPLAVLELAHNAVDLRPAVESTCLELARRGLRSLAVARTAFSESDSHRPHLPGSGAAEQAHHHSRADGFWVFLGLIAFKDNLRHDAQDTVADALAHGIDVKIVTGDTAANALNVCRELGLGSTVIGANALPVLPAPDHEDEPAGSYQLVPSELALTSNYAEVLETADAYAQVHPQQKQIIADVLMSRGSLLSATGESVSDIPLLRKATVGVAVEGAVDAARSAADVVLTKPGLSVLVCGIKIAREVVQRMRSAITYRMACSLRLLLFVFIGTVFVRPDSCRYPGFMPVNGMCPSQGGHGEPVPSSFRLPTVFLIIVTILHFFVTSGLPAEKFRARRRPETWDFGRVLWTSLSLSSSLVVSSLLLLHWALTSHDPRSTFRQLHLPPLAYRQIFNLMFLQIGVSDALAFYSAKEERLFMLSPRPGALGLGVTALRVLLVAAFAVFWPFHPAPHLSSLMVLFVLVYCLFWFVIGDLVKAACLLFLDNLELSQSNQARYGNTATLSRLREAQRRNRRLLGAKAAGGGDLRASYVAGRAVAGGGDRHGAVQRLTRRVRDLEGEVHALNSTLVLLRRER